MGLDQRLAAAGVARDGVDRHRVVGRHQPGVDQRPQQRDGAGRIAAGVRHSPRLGDERALLRRQFRKAVDPARRDPVRGRGVDDPRSAGRQSVGDRDRLPGGIVGQAQHDEIHFLHQRALGRRVLALVGRDRADGQAGHAGEPLGNSETGGTGLAIDEHGWLVGLGGGHLDTYSREGSVARQKQKNRASGAASTNSAQAKFLIAAKACAHDVGGRRWSSSSTCALYAVQREPCQRPVQMSPLSRRSPAIGPARAFRRSPSTSPWKSLPGSAARR